MDSKNLPAETAESDVGSIGDSGSTREPAIGSVYNFLMYGASIPERALRSSSAMIGGVLQKSTELLVPQAFRSSKSYSIFVTQMLDMMTENIGGVARKNEIEIADGESERIEKKATEVENYVARKTVGNFVDLAGLATLHLSPITILAVVSDIAYGSKTYLNELTAELKREGVIGEDSTVNNASDLLDAVSNASGSTAQAFDLPPLSADGLRQTINETREAVRKINPVKLIPQSEIAKLWSDMKEIANRENANMFEVSSAMTMYTLNHVKTVGKGALSTIRVAGSMMDRHIFEHYFDSIKVIRNEGIYVTVAQNAKPYIEAVWANFSTEKETWTEDLLSGRMVGRAWEGFRGWFSKKDVDQTVELTDSEREADLSSSTLPKNKPASGKADPDQ